ncbi:hypothetical protein ACSSS7_006233 [Eimeria intestinalis]
MAANDFKLFGRWSFEDVNVSDLSLVDYLAIKNKAAVLTPHTSGRNSGKKIMAIRIVKHAFEIIALMSDKNPIQVLVQAVERGGPREDSTRIGSAGVVRRQAVDVSPLRRVNQAIYLICTGARLAAFRNLKTMSECLADEIMNCAKESSNSYAIKKKDEIERVAKANR